MAPLSGSLAEKREILDRLRGGGPGADEAGSLPDARELARAVEEVRSRFPLAAEELAGFFAPLLAAAEEAEAAAGLRLHPSEPAGPRFDLLPLDLGTPAGGRRERMDEVTWARPGPGPLDLPPPQPAPAADSADGSSLLFRLALSTAALLVLFVFARGFWWPGPEPRPGPPERAAASPRPAPAPPAAADRRSPDRTLAPPAPPAAVEVVEEAAPPPARPAPASEPRPPAARPRPPSPERAEAPAAPRRVPPPWEEGPQPADLLKPGPGIQEPVPLELPRFSYPVAARGTGLKADVRLALLVDERGRVIEARVRDGAPPDLGFSEAALAAARRIPFQPATRYDVPGKMWTELILEFAE